MIQGAAAAYARLTCNFWALAAASWQARVLFLRSYRRNLAPLLGDGRFHAAHRRFTPPHLAFALEKADAPGSLIPMAQRPPLQVLTPRRSATFCLLLALALSLASHVDAQGASTDAAPGATGPGSVVRETHGAWQVSCRTPPGAKEEKCALVQSVTAEDRPNVGLTVVFYKAIGENKKLLRVVVPLGVLLPTGLGLKIDNQDVGNAPFLKCGKRGCVAEVVLQDEVINKLKKGTNAMFIIFDTPEAGIGIPVSLQGFSDAFASLK
jgi:invasion protein IalB